MDPITLITVACLAGLVNAGYRHVTGRSLFEAVGGVAGSVAGGVRDVLASGRDRAGTVLRTASEPSRTVVRDRPSGRPGTVRGPSSGPSGTPRPGRPVAIVDTAPGTDLSDPERTVGPSGDPHPGRHGRPGRTTTRTVTRTRGWSWDWTVTLVRPRPETPDGRPAAGDGTPPGVPGGRPGDETPPPPPAGPHPNVPQDRAEPVTQSPPVTPDSPAWGTPTRPGDTPSPDDAPTPHTDQTQEGPVTMLDTTDTVTGVSEDVPEHIRQSEAIAVMIDDAAETFGVGLVGAVEKHIASAESIPGFPPSLQGEWEDDVLTPVRQALDLLKAAAESARAVADREDRDLAPLVEAADGAPQDGGGLTVDALRPA